MKTCAIPCTSVLLELGMNPNRSELRKSNSGNIFTTGDLIAVSYPGFVELLSPLNILISKKSEIKFQKIWNNKKFNQPLSGLISLCFKMRNDYILPFVNNINTHTNMKNNLLICLFILLGFIYSCDKKDDISIEQLESFVIIGDLDANNTRLDTVIRPRDRGESLLFPIDIDLDGVEDYCFYIFYNYSPCVYFANFRFDCLHDSAKVCTDDAIRSPEILSFGDTLNMDRYWLSKKFSLLDLSGQ